MRTILADILAIAARSDRGDGLTYNGRDWAPARGWLAEADAAYARHEARKLFAEGHRH